LKITPKHPWDLDPASARALQRKLAEEVDVSRPLGPCRLLAAADVSYLKGDEQLYAAVVVVEMPDLRLIERVGVAGPSVFPYVPGLLSFREAPPVLDAFRKLQTVPDVVLCDGQGIAHPRRLGLACHLGLWLEIPTIGCAKSRLCGHSEEPAPARGSRSELIDRGEVVGSVVRTRDRVSPLYVSPGHLCDLEGAVEVVLATAPRYRLPLPAKMAHEYVNLIRREVSAGRPFPD